MPETQRTQSNVAGNGADHRNLGERVGQISQDAQQLWSEAQGAVSEFTEKLDLRGRVERHPYGMVLAAVGVGYVLGGGLFSRFTARVVRLGFRLAALPLVKEELIALARGAMQGAAEGNGPAESQASPAEPPKTV